MISKISCSNSRTRATQMNKPYDHPFCYFLCFLVFIFTFKSCKMTHNPEEIKWLISNSKEPLIFKHLLSPEILKWDLNEWASKLKNQELEFRLGKFEHTPEPQWERKTEIIKSSFDYFLECLKSEDKWLYFDYKYLDNWLTNIEELKNIEWTPLGFPNIAIDDCTIWIGTKGAHTPCHIDTYGFNLIFQVYGKKLWIVAPPEENLKPTRIPYEESSIYSKLNFFSPTIRHFDGVNNCRKIILNPGEVLYLPHKWWHYVENLETAISINVWIPVPQDDEERLKESIVQLFVKQMVEVSNRELANQILNPNMDQAVLDSETNNMVKIINRCKTIYKNNSNNKKIKTNSRECIESDSEMNECEIMRKYSFVEKIPKMSKNEFSLFLENQASRFSNPCGSTKHEENDILELLDVLTDIDVVSLMTKKLVEKSG